MNSNQNSDILGGVDLNLIQESGLLQQSEFLSHQHVCRQNPVRAIDGFSSMDDLHQNRRPVWRKLSSPNTALYRSVSYSGLRATDLPGESSGHRSLSRGAIGEAVSHGYSYTSQTLHAGRCQRKTRLENLRRLCPTSDHPSQKIVRKRRLWNRPVEYRLRAGFDDHRLVPVGISLGAISKYQGCRENAYAARSSRQYSKLYPYYRWQVPRCQSARSSDTGSWCHLYHGSCISGFRPVVRTRSSWRFLCNPRQVESPSAKAILSFRRSYNWFDLRSDGCSHRFLLAKELSKTVASNPVQRSGNRENPDIFDQQLYSSRADHHRTLSMSLAGRIVFQMDQATFTNQKILRHIGERGEDTNMDRSLGVCAGSHYQKASQSGCFALHFITDLLDHFVRENPFKQRLSQVH